MSASTKPRTPGVRDVAALARVPSWGHPVAKERDRDESLAWLVWSFVVGAPLSRAPMRWGAASGRRALVRWAGVAAVAMAGWAYLGERLVAWTETGVWSTPGVTSGWAWRSWVTAAAVGCVQGWRLAMWVTRQRHWRRWVRPLDRALRPELGYPANFPTQGWLVVPPDLAEDEAGVRVILPSGFVPRPKQQNYIEAIIRQKLGLGDDDNVTIVWRLASRSHFVQVKAKAKPPARVSFADSAVVELVERARESRPVVGLAGGDEIYTFDWDDDAPHVAVVGRTGRGKTSFIRGLVAQAMHHGARAVVLDWKRRSHRFLKGLEGVTYCRDVSEIHDQLIALGAEAIRRNKLADEYPDDVEPPWQRVVIVLEELNATQEELVAYWRDECGGKGASPALRGYRQLLFAGRQVKMHIITASGSLTAQAAGGTAARAQYGLIAMAGYKPAQWKMTVPEITPIPAASDRIGRWQVVKAWEATEVQVIKWTEAEARAWAASGKSSARRDVAGVADGDARSPQGEPTATVAGRPQLRLIDSTPAQDAERDGPVSLWRASIDKGDALVGLTYDQLRQATRRDPEFPTPAGKGPRGPLYDPNDLARWAANRERGGGRAG